MENFYTTSSNQIEYKLSYTVGHHEKALRSIALNKNRILVTGSLDGICAIFRKDEAGKFIFDKNTQLHRDSVYIVRSTVDNNFFLSGGKDAIVNLMDCEGNLIKDYIGHTKIVNSLSQAEPDYFISGSWDGSAIVWDIETSQSLYQLSGHSHAVATLALPNKKFITASQDKAIKFWDNEKLIRSVELAHDDIIREIILDDQNGTFYTCSNDCFVKQWTLDGRLIGKLDEHEGFLFSIKKKNGILFSGGDEKMVKYWQGSKVLGNLPHPNTIWDMACDENGDLITACGDGSFRVFSSDPNRWMNEQELSDYNELCLRAISGEEGGNSQVNAETLLPIAELESTPGKEGEIKLFNANGKGVAYVKKDGTWNLIGEVMEIKSTKKLYPGDKYFKEGEYDYIFDVELTGNYTKIPINKDDNCLVAAEKFITRENLHRNYLDEVTRFLRENVKSQNKLSQPKKPVAKRKKIEVFSHYNFPKHDKNFYETIETEKPLQKIMEFNKILLEDGQYADNCLDDERTTLFNSILEKIRNKSHHETTILEDNEIELFFFNILTWPMANLIPVLDVSRMLLLLKCVDKDFSNNYYKTQIFNRVVECLTKGENPHKIISLRILNNMFKGPRGCEMMESKLKELLPILNTLKNTTNISIRSAMAGLLLNYSTEIHYKNLIENQEFISLIGDLINNETEPDNIMDLVYALCNMCSDSKKITMSAKQTNFYITLKKFGISNFDFSQRQFLEDLIFYFEDFTN